MGLCSDSTSYYRVFGPCLDFSLIPCEEKKAVSVLVEETGFPPIRIEWGLSPIMVEWGRALCAPRPAHT